MNNDITIACIKSGVMKYEVANKLGITDSSFSRKLRNKLSKEEKNKILKIISELSKEKEN